MSLKAGRVGVNPSQVDPIDGSIKSSATGAYTKAETDAKFLTQTDAASTYESKSEASTAHNALQPKTLAVPISMLIGSQLVTKTTVESVIATMDNAMSNEELTEKFGTTLTYRENITSGKDLDNYKTMGVYNLVGTGIVHTPLTYQTDGIWCPMLVMGDDTGGYKQILIRAQQLFVRSFGGSPASWGNWFQYSGTDTGS